MFPPQDATVAHQSDRAPSGVRAATEAEEEELIARLVVLDDEPVCLLDVARQPQAQGSSAEALPRPGPNALLVVDALLDTGTVVPGEAESHLGDVRGAGLAVTLLVSRVPRAVATQHQTLGHNPTPSVRIVRRSRRDAKAQRVTEPSIRCHAPARAGPSMTQA